MATEFTWRKAGELTGMRAFGCAYQVDAEGSERNPITRASDR